MRILIDTNILIPLEDTHGVLNNAYSDLIRMASEHQCQIILHPGSLEDLSRDKDDTRKQNILAKAKKYPMLESPPTPKEEKLNELGLKTHKDNDRIDNLLLYAMYQSAANILISEDIGLHKKAKRLGISDNVHYIQQAITFLKNLRSKEVNTNVNLPDVEDKPLHNIDYRHSFFDSLRDGYVEFDDWYRGCCSEGRRAWSVFDGDNIAALLIHKNEIDENVSHSRRLIGKSLKLCTFKVEESHRGRKLGELLIKTAFEYAIKNRCNYVYLTIRPNIHEHLRILCEDFGFYSIGKCISGRDEVYIKEMPHEAPLCDLHPLNYHKKFFPFFKCQNVKKFIVPIVPYYYNILFPDNHRNIDRQLFYDDPTVPGNTLKKAYICSAHLSSMMPGDIVIFYRSRDKKALTTIGVVEQYSCTDDANSVAAMVSKRTVYTMEEISKKCVKPIKVMLFRQAKHLEHTVSLKWLNSNGVKGNIQTIRQISDDTFKKIIEKAGVTNCA